MAEQGGGPRRLLSSPWVFSPPPWKGEVGRGVDPGVRRPGRGSSRPRPIPLIGELPGSAHPTSSLKGGGEKTAAAPPRQAMAMSASRRKISRCDRPERRGASPKGRAPRAAATFRDEAGDSPPSPVGDRAAAPARAVRRGSGPAGRCRVLRAASVRDRRRRAETGRRISRPDILPCIRGGPFRRAA